MLIGCHPKKRWVAIVALIYMNWTSLSLLRMPGLVTDASPLNEDGPILVGLISRLTLPMRRR
jgi:hypothetical protein